MKKNHFSLCSVLATAVVFMGSSSASCAPVTVNFTGTVSSVTSVLFGNPFSFTDPISGSYTYETAIADTNSSTTSGIYEGALTAYSLNLGNGATGSISSPGNIHVTNALGQDGFTTQGNLLATGPSQVFSDGFGNIGTYQLESMSLSLLTGGPSPSVLSSDDLVGVLPTDFQTQQFTLVYRFLSGDRIINGSNPADILSVSGNALTSSFDAPAAVPIPAALPLLLSALGFFGFMGWRRKKAAA